MLKKTCTAYVKAVNEADRTVEQIVSVFGNEDRVRDIVEPGAFVNTLAKWAASGNVLPAYFSHQWDDPFSNIGGVIDAKELAALDPLLEGTPVYEFGGLYVKYQFDPEGENQKADQVFRLLLKRRIVQASFAYDIVDSQRNSNGTNSLKELDIFEVGPTLLGANPLTTLLAAKSLSEVAEETGVPEEQVQAIAEAMSKDVQHTYVATSDGESEGRCVLCGKTQTAVAHINRLSNASEGVKSFSFAGSFEERQGAIKELITDWAMESADAAGGLFDVELMATFASSVVFRVEGLEDPYGGGKVYEASIVDNDDESIGLALPIEVSLEQVIKPKSRIGLIKSTQLIKTDTTISEQDVEKSTLDEDNKAPELSKGSAEVASTEDESKSAKALIDALKKVHGL